MFIKKKKNRSGTISIVVAEKTKGSYKELVTIGIAKDANDIDSLVNDGREWISKEESRRHPQLDLYGEEREACDREREEVRRVLSQVRGQWKFSGDKHKSLQVDTERTFHQRYPLVML